jgi:hypothetical protein
MKLLLFFMFFVVHCNGMADVSCGSVKSPDWNSPNDQIARLNGSGCPLDRLPDCPFKCKSYYVQNMIECMKNMIVALYAENLIDLETLEREILSLRNEKNAEAMNQVLEKINQLKEQ